MATSKRTKYLRQATKKVRAKKKELKEKPPIGRPASIPPVVELDKVYSLCLLGLTDAELATYYGVSNDTFKKWLEWEEFLGVIRQGREEADALVTKSVFRSANGYSHKESEIKTVRGTVTRRQVRQRFGKNVRVIGWTNSNTVIEIIRTKHYPPNIDAAKFILTNRQRNRWKNKFEDEAGSNVQPTGPVVVNVITDSETKARLLKAEQDFENKKP